MGIRTNNAKLAYYSFDKIFSFNAVFNFVIGARGLGKTFGAKKQVIRNAIKRDEQFIYLRRFKSELVARNTFFADLVGEFPGWEFRINGNTAEMRKDIPDRDAKDKTGWKVIGYFVSLSTAQTQKSIAFPMVTTIIFDEFIIEKGAVHYLPNEAVALQNFYATVDRWKDKTRVLFLANSVSIENPYFIYYKIRPDQIGEYWTSDDGFIACHFADSAEFSKGVFATRFGKFIQGTEYAEYAVNSEFSDNSGNMIEPKPSEAKYAFTLETDTGTFSIWQDAMGPNWYIQEKRPKKELMFTMVPHRVNVDKKLLVYNDRLLQVLRRAFVNGYTYFDAPHSRNAFIEIFKR